ncbi:MAG: CBS domain-containing protein [Planctomycetota bacterium]|jgi:CBS domain-containing protein/anti-sigma regulatory factor (Ser/Thr protein kinase)
MPEESEKVRFTRTQELVYEMKVDEVMTRSVVTVSPQTSMSELREVLRRHRISGAPVVEDGRLVGIISIEDFIRWLRKGPTQAKVGERMTQEVTAIYDDEPLVQLVNMLDRSGYGRLPVVERAEGKLVGVVTKGDIVAGLLHKLEIGFQEQEVRQWRASHLFEDIIADRTALILRYDVVGKDLKKAGSGATRLREVLTRLEINPQIRRRAAIIAYEAEMNIVIYTDGGELAATVAPNLISIEARDQGPGIADVKLAFTPGYSTAADWVRELGFGAGMGLCNIRRCADETNLDSVVGEGTRLEARVVIEDGLG